MPRTPRDDEGECRGRVGEGGMGRGVVKENKIEAGRERKYLNIKPLYFPLVPLYI